MRNRSLEELGVTLILAHSPQAKGRIERLWNTFQDRSLQIERALCFKQQRTVAKDNTISFDGTVLQIPKTSAFGSHANRRIDVHLLLDGAVELFYKTEKIARFDSKQRTQWACIERQLRGRGSAMVRFPYSPSSESITLT